MPVNNTKYNYVNKLHIDLSNNSYTTLGSNHIFTCDVSDTKITDPYLQDEGYKIYLGSKASFLIHRFSRASNCQNNFNNIKNLFNIKIPARVPIDASSSFSQNSIQKNIQNQSRVSSSLYTSNLSSLNVSKDIHNDSGGLGLWNNSSDRIYDYKNSNNKNKGVDVKHNSYDRYLARKKSQYLKSETYSSSVKPLFGNKTMKFGLINCVSNCK